MPRVQIIVGFLLLFTLKIKCECQHRSFSSVEVRVCAGKTFIGEVTKVSSNRNVTQFQRGNNKILQLRSVFLVALGIATIHPGASLNTPIMNKVKLDKNRIERIPWGVFNNLGFKEIDLSQNQISHIDQKAFSHMSNLQTLNLYQNELTKYDKEWFKNSINLEVLDLSHNKISKFPFRSFDTFSKLRHLDVSFNRIMEIEAESFKNVKSLEFLDLTRNSLTALSPDIFPADIKVKKLQIALNKLSFISEDVLRKVQSIMLQPNPWQCPCLDKIYKWAREHNMQILNPEENQRIKVGKDIPACVFKVNNSHVCALNFDDEFLSTQEVYFKHVNYLHIVRD